MKRKQVVSLARLAEMQGEPGAELYLTKPVLRGFDYEVIRFSSRKALEEFNKKAGLRPLVYTVVEKNMAIYKHQKEKE